jgi:hypothetical protein
VPAVLSYMRAGGSIAPWNEFWDSYFAWELEPVDDTVWIRTDLAAVGEDSACASTHDVYGLWPRVRCPILLVQSSRPMTPDGGLMVSPADAERFVAKVRDATVVDVDADHYSIFDQPSISAVERFVGGRRLTTADGARRVRLAGSCSYGAKSRRAAKSPRMPGWRRIVVESVGWLPRRAGALDSGFYIPMWASTQPHTV